MAWYSSILGGAANSAAGTTVTSTGTGQTLSSSQVGHVTLAAQQAYSNAVWQTGQINSATYDPITGITAYAKMIGWTVDHVYLPKGVDSNDPKVAVLKLTNINEVIKDVGVRVSDEHFYVMRDPNANE